MSVVNINSSNFEQEVTNSDKPVLLDFWASWWGHCVELLPTIEALAGEANDIKICKVNVDEAPELARKYKVMGIPSLIAIKDDKEIKVTGVKSKEEILALFE